MPARPQKTSKSKVNADIPPKSARKSGKQSSRRKRRLPFGLHLSKVLAAGLLMSIAASFALQAAVMLNASRVARPEQAAPVTLARLSPVPPVPAIVPAAPEFVRAAFVLPKLEKIEIPEDATEEHVAPVDPAVQRRQSLRHKIHFQAHTPETCLPPSLMGVVYDMAEKYGSVTILSTYRDPRRNARVGGVSKSFHLECRAIDFKVAGNPKDIMEILRQRPEVGGYKRYPMGFYHIDDGPKRSW